MKANKKDDRAPLGLDEAISWIEEALQASFGQEDKDSRGLIVKTLNTARPDAQLQAWLETVAAELGDKARGPLPGELIRAMAERMIEDRQQFLDAHGPIDRKMIGNLLRRP